MTMILNDHFEIPKDHVVNEEKEEEEQVPTFWHSIPIPSCTFKTRSKGLSHQEFFVEINFIWPFSCETTLLQLQKNVVIWQMALSRPFLGQQHHLGGA